MRKIQLANLALLKELDYVCRQNNLRYWIDFGTLLGAVRHKGFIPWDDDADVGMMREDYEKLIEIFNSSSRNKDIFASHSRSEHTAHHHIKIRHKKCPCLFVDIFPYDIYGGVLSENEQLEQSGKMRKSYEKLRDSISDKTTDEELQSAIRKMSAKFISHNNCEKSDIVWGLDFGHGWSNWFSKYDVIFPLKEISFEGCSLPCINKPDDYLKRVYGNYMSYPKKLGIGHAMFLKLSEEESAVINDLAELK